MQPEPLPRLQLLRLSLTNFKNIAAAELEFSPRVNCLLGNNGMGKSNLLDALHCLSLAKSYTGVPDRMLIRRGEDFAIARGSYLRRDTPEELSLGLANGRRKSLKRGGKEYGRLSEHIGAFPLVLVSPRDQELIRGAADERRRWLDMVLGQTDATYLDCLIRYGHAVEQRNRLLRARVRDPGLFEAVEAQICAVAPAIAQTRHRRLQELAQVFHGVYATISGGHEQVSLAYQSELLQGGLEMQDMLDRARDRDQMLGHTTVGPHRDDISMELEAMPMRRTASEGQCKTFTIALKMAQHEFLGRAVGLEPLLLLDDVFDRLDAQRVERIMQMVAGGSFGQIFVTDTNRAHLDSIVEATGGDHRKWAVAQGSFSQYY